MKRKSDIFPLAKCQRLKGLFTDFTWGEGEGIRFDLSILLFFHESCDRYGRFTDVTNGQNSIDTIGPIRKIDHSGHHGSRYTISMVDTGIEK